MAFFGEVLAEGPENEAEINRQIWWGGGYHPINCISQKTKTKSRGKEEERKQSE